MDLFSYANPKNPKGAFKWIDIDLLHIPVETYQRDKVSSKKVSEMADSWDWFLCGVLTVIPKKDGYEVADGGHRLRAAIENTKIKKLPCMVYPIETLQGAAKGFVGTQRLRTNTKSCENHRGDLVAKNPIALEAEKIIRDCGYHTDKGNGTEYKFDAITTLYNLIKIDKEIAEYAMMICSEIADGERIFNHILGGVFQIEFLCRKNGIKTPFDDSTLSKLKKEGPIGIVREVNKVKVLSGSNCVGQGRSIPAQGILNIINKGRGKRNQLKLNLLD